MIRLALHPENTADDAVVVVGVVVELPQTSDNHHRSARAIRGRRTSYSRFVQVCSWSWLLWIG